jgi:type IV secretory pathway TrbF-like protein
MRLVNARRITEMAARIRQSRTVPALIALAVLGWIAASSPAARAQSAGERAIIFSAVDEAGKPVKDIKTDEILIREDGVDREIVSVKPSTETLNVMLLADTTAAVDDMLLDVRTALIAFVHQVRAVSPDAQISLMEFGQAAVTVVPFTTSDADLEKGINRLSGKPRSASVLLEAINAASNNLAKRPSPRRVIVSLNIEPGDEQSREDPNRIVESLRKSLAQLWCVSIQKGALRNPQRDVVLNAFTKNTGGDRQFIVGQSAIATHLKSFADVLTSQYEATYKRPATKALAVQIGVTRPGVRLHASGFAPQ